MKKIMLLLFLIALTAKAGEIKPKTTVTEVTVYLNGARITATSPVSLPKGTSVIHLAGLSPLIDESSIQISGLGSNISVLSVNFSINSLEKQSDSEKIKSLQSLLAEKRRERALLLNANKGLQEEEALLNTNKKLNGENQNLTLEQVTAFSEYYRKRVTQIQTEIYDNNVKIAELDNEIADINAEQAKLKTPGSKQLGEIVVKVDAAVASAINLVTKYTVSNAGWFPVYDIKTDDIQKPVTIFYNAHVYQNTGEDWDNVKITLSTGDPNTNNAKPEVDPHYLNFVRNYNAATATSSYNYKYNPMIKTVSGTVVDESGLPSPGTSVNESGTNNTVITDINGNYTINVTSGRALQYTMLGMKTVVLPVYARQMNVKLEEDAQFLEEVVVVGYGTTGGNNYDYNYNDNRRKDKQEEENYTATGDVKEQGVAATTFKISKPYSIPSIEEVTIITIDKFELATEYEYFSAPVLNENVFLTAKVKDWEQYDLLAGEANIYFEGSFAGTTFIDPLQTTDETLTISLGVDPNITVERKEIDDTKSKSFLGGNRILDKHYEINIKNNRGTEINLVLKDRIPVSRNKQIKIEDVEVYDAGYDKDKGLLTWVLNLQPKQSVKKELAYQVKYPRDMHININ